MGADRVNIMDINIKPNSTSQFTTDQYWAVASQYNGLDGYVDNKKIIVSFTDMNNTGIADNPELFYDIVAPTSNASGNFIVQQKYTVSPGQEDYSYMDNSDNIVIILNNETELASFTTYTDGQYFYFTSSKVVKKLDKTSGKLAEMVSLPPSISRTAFAVVPLMSNPIQELTKSAPVKAASIPGTIPPL